MSMFRIGSKTFLKSNLSIPQNIRNISFSNSLKLKEITTVEDGNNIVISGKIVESERKPFVVTKEGHACPLCSNGLNVKHTDVLILSQFLRSDGCMLPKRITGLCSKQQRRVSSLVAMAQKAGLMPYMNPANSKKDPRKRYKWEKYNKYFDESTIKFK